MRIKTVKSDNQLVYGFSLQGSCKNILYGLKQVDCCYVVYPNNVDQYLNMLLRDQPKYILGLRRGDHDMMEIEEYCYDLENEKKVKINSFLVSNNNFSISLGDNLRVDMISFEIMKLIESGKLSSQYTLLNLPRKIKPWKMIKIIDEHLVDLALRGCRI